MRQNLSQTNQKIPGWKNRPTSRPTSLMMSTVFVGIFILRSSTGRTLHKPLTPLQLQYLAILEVSPEVFAKPTTLQHSSRMIE
ncbi:MAG: hypothetical protein FJY85_07040 [Deltaproteobacteria bacterium]|nr:hypothetical protein [Deltaproteobacteria bacterium]